jgi:Helix-turn-helix domain
MRMALVLSCKTRRGDIPAFRLGGSWRFPARSFDEWIAKRTRHEPE